MKPQPKKEGLRYVILKEGTESAGQGIKDVIKFDARTITKACGDRVSKHEESLANRLSARTG